MRFGNVILRTARVSVVLLLILEVPAAPLLCTTIAERRDQAQFSCQALAPAATGVHRGYSAADWGSRELALQAREGKNPRKGERHPITPNQFIERTPLPKVAKNQFADMGLVYVKQLLFLTEGTVRGEGVGPKTLARMQELGLHFLPGRSPRLSYAYHNSQIISGAYLAAGLSEEEKGALAKIHEALNGPAIDHLYALMQYKKDWATRVKNAGVSNPMRLRIEEHVARLYAVLERRNRDQSQESFWDPFAGTSINSDAALRLMTHGTYADWAMIGLSTDWMREGRLLQSFYWRGLQENPPSWDGWYQGSHNFYANTPGVRMDGLVLELRKALLEFALPAWGPLSVAIKGDAWRVIITASWQQIRDQLRVAWEKQSLSEDELARRAKQVAHLQRDNLRHDGYFGLAKYLLNKRHWTTNQLALWLMHVFKTAAKNLGLEDPLLSPALPQAA